MIKKEKACYLSKVATYTHYEDHLKSKDLLLEERYERITDLKNQLNELKAELESLKKI